MHTVFTQVTLSKKHWLLVNKYDEGDDLPEGNSTLDSSDLTSKLKQPFYNKPISNMVTRSKSSSNSTHKNDNTTPTDYNTNSFPVNDLYYDDEDS